MMWVSRQNNWKLKSRKARCLATDIWPDIHLKDSVTQALKLLSMILAPDTQAFLSSVTFPLIH
ncbi:hypothetical protein SRABI106_03611 [Rahnella aquatilis]|nr:hypothetical protein SRABI106_03611 [Rahnella aquatilis]